MNNIDKVYENTSKINEFASGYIKYLKRVLDNIDLNSIIRLEGELESARKNEKTVFIAGNGGSAATATTMANDIGSDITRKTNTDQPFRMFALTDNSSVMTAISNDIGYENVFTNQLRIHYRPGDSLIVISASGNSPNVVKAAEWVKSQGGKVIAFLGFDGGILKETSDVVVHVKTVTGEYGPVEDVHLIINHILAHWFQYKMK